MAHRNRLDNYSDGKLHKEVKTLYKDLRKAEDRKQVEQAVRIRRQIAEIEEQINFRLRRLA
jgi:excinuclease UvrABC helicase subunit UvrB